jgi:plasmid replication initiation protein
MAIKKNYLIEKRNILNEIRSNNMNLQELRFFSIYLAKINARDVSTRTVHFPIVEFQRIMDMGKLNITQLQNTTDSLLKKIVSVPLENGGFKKFQLFKRCRFDKNEDGEWFVEFDSHDEALPLMFEFKDKYFTYELWNALRLKSSNQLRMYEILKQYEHLGERVISVVDLKALLGLNKNDYPRYSNLKSKIIDVCQEALETYTDIKFTYEPAGKLGQGGKIKALRFYISHNENYVDPLALEDFIDMNEIQHGVSDENIIDVHFKNERLAFLSEACSKEFNEAEMQVLHNLLIALNPFLNSPHLLDGNMHKYETELYDYLKRKYDELNWRADKTEIKNRFGYLKKMLEADVSLNSL